jgi:phosphatidylserine/phosphatidylglycerophosphate/cardiolipin synthase-like enzyme
MRQPDRLGAANRMPTLPAEGRTGILAPGRNCWRVAHADRGAVLVDGAAYFDRLDQALRRACRSIIIVGWDFDASIKLRPQDGEAAETLGALLRSLVEARPELEIRILIWNLSTLHAPGAALPLVLGDEWQKHPRIQLRLDGDHPIYAAQHQKIIVLDDKVAFVGGTDLTVDRWDTPIHRYDEPLRKTPAGKPYGPVHDMEMVVSGEAARAVGDLARARWRQITGEEVASADSDGDPWPEGLEPEFRDVLVGIARTCPAWRRNPGIYEVAELTRDALSAARSSIYIEAQYLADFRLCEVIERRLSDPDGPEVIIVVTRTMHGFLEGVIMNGNRRRLLRRLKRADRFDRLRVWHPCVPGDAGDCEVLIHAKLVIVDNEFLRIGSSNLNNRSTGLDAECDLAIEAHDAASRRGIAAVRARLLGEHLGVPPEVFAAAAAEENSLLRAIDRLNGDGRGLRPFNFRDGGSVRPMLGTRLLDPRKPASLLARLGLRRRRPGQTGRVPRPAVSARAQ